MAKRRRLGPAVITGQGVEQGPTPDIDPIAAPPIARVAGEAATEAAARELADELTRARAEGRLVQDIALDQIDETHLTRDRISVTAGDMAALEASIAARGQQMPVEVVDLWASRSSSEAIAQRELPHSSRPKGGGATEDSTPRYGLISGWRRLAAIRALAKRHPDRFPTIRAVLRRPEGAAEAYLAMVEENELRVGLSYYERAQVAARASDMGIFDGAFEAVQSLFPTASKAKRSKINAFVRVFRVLDPVLGYPEALTERFGLRIAKALDAGQGPRFYKALQEGGPFEDAAAELARIDQLLTPKSGSAPQDRVEPQQFPGGLELARKGKALTLSGAGVDDALLKDLSDWLAERQTGR